MNKSISAGPDLAARLAVLEHERAIRRTLFEYCHSLDYSERDDVVSYFTPDALIDVVQKNAVLASGTRTERGAAHRGHEQIARFYDAVLAGGPNHHSVSSHHFVTNTRIEWDGDEALVDSLFVIVMADAKNLGPYVMTGMTSVAGYGRYLDRMVRDPEGTWKFQTREIRFEAGLTAQRQR
jgi:hypothetical protein